MINYICPVCKNELKTCGNTYKCPLCHSFDRSKFGYVNLILGGKNHGDNKEMVAARRDFLDSGLYSPLRDKLCEIIKEFSPSSYLDCGCGEGYYTEKIVNTSKPDESFGIDISKEALKLAGKRLKNTSLAAASVYDLPFPDNSFDLISNVFSPLAEKEFKRVLKKDGRFIFVIPGSHHLYGIKSIVYEKPYLNEIKDYDLEGFEFINSVSVKFDAEISGDTAMTLWKMTPYFYRSPKEGMQKLSQSSIITTPIDFEILVYSAK